MPKPLGFSSEDIMRAGLQGAPHSPWHDPPGPGERWCWHASQLASCPRQTILSRANLSCPEERPLDGLLTMHLGTVFHAEMEHFLERFSILTGKARIVVQEVGFTHSTLNLKAKPDCLLDVNGIGLVLMDFKTEHERAAQNREREANERGARSHVRPEHALQVAATAVVLEDNGYGPINQGFVLYCSKNSFWIGDLTSNTVDLANQDLRMDVARRVAMLDMAWEEYEVSASNTENPRYRLLPVRYPKGHWNCTPRGANQRRTDGDGSGHGKYCAARRSCFLFPNGVSP